MKCALPGQVGLCDHACRNPSPASVVVLMDRPRSVPCPAPESAERHRGLENSLQDPTPASFLCPGPGFLLAPVGSTGFLSKQKGSLLTDLCRLRLREKLTALRRNASSGPSGSSAKQINPSCISIPPPPRKVPAFFQEVPLKGVCSVSVCHVAKAGLRGSQFPLGATGTQLSYINARPAPCPAEPDSPSRNPWQLTDRKHGSVPARMAPRCQSRRRRGTGKLRGDPFWSRGAYVMVVCRKVPEVFTNWVRECCQEALVKGPLGRQLLWLSPGPAGNLGVGSGSPLRPVQPGQAVPAREEPSALGLLGCRAAGNRRGGPPQRKTIPSHCWALGWLDDTAKSHPF